VTPIISISKKELPEIGGDSHIDPEDFEIKREMKFFFSFLHCLNKNSKYHYYREMARNSNNTEQPNKRQTEESSELQRRVGPTSNHVWEKGYSALVSVCCSRVTV